MTMLHEHRTDEEREAVHDVHDAPVEPHEERRWRERPVLGGAVAILAVLVPVVVAVMAARVVAGVLPPPSGVGGTVAWWAAVLVSSTIVLALVDRVARRALPLAALLRMCLVFPDRAPSRFKVAFRAGSIRNLHDRIADAKAHGVEGDPSAAAATVIELVSALSSHDRRTRGHSERVRAFTDLIADELHLSQGDRDRLRWAALLHDIGKLHVPSPVLNKPASPSDAEWRVLHRHPEEGARITAPLAGWLGPWSDTIVQHHERWDGSGYPKGLAGEEISLGARIVGVADAFEVMTGLRSYQRPMSARSARAELARCAGTHFDPQIVRAFLNVGLGRLRRAMGPITWLAEIPFIGAVPQLESHAVALASQVPPLAGAAGGVALLAVGGAVAPAGVPTNASASTPAPTESVSDQGSAGGAGTAADPVVLDGVGDPGTGDPTDATSPEPGAPGASDGGAPATNGTTSGVASTDGPASWSPRSAPSLPDRSWNDDSGSGDTTTTNGGGTSDDSGTISDSDGGTSTDADTVEPPSNRDRGSSNDEGDADVDQDGDDTSDEDRDTRANGNGPPAHANASDQARENFGQPPSDGSTEEPAPENPDEG